LKLSMHETKILYMIFKLKTSPLLY